MNLSEWLPIINILGFIFLGIGYIFVQFRTGGKGVAKEVIDTYKTQVDQLRQELIEAKTDYFKQLDGLKTEITNLNLKLANIEGQLIEKDKKIAELITIFQGRDPELVQILRDIKDFMKKLEGQSKTNQTRNEKIDVATDKEEGHVLRKNEEI